MANRTLVHKNSDYPVTSTEIRDLKNTTALDLSFQSRGRWDSAQERAYITSLITGMAPSKIVIASLEDCADNCEHRSEDYKYFKAWLDKGFKYVSIDGNNRTITLMKYFGDKVALLEGEYLLPNGRVIVINDSNCIWSKHPRELREHIEKNVYVTVAKYVNANRADLSLLFKNINDGMSLNSQELRNAILVPFSGWVRDMVDAVYKTMLKKVFPTEKQYNRRKVDEFIVAMAIYLSFGTSRSIQSAEMDRAYQDNSPVAAGVRQHEKTIKNFAKFVEKFTDKKLKEHSTMMNLFMAYEYLISKDYVLRDEKDFYNWFLATENRRRGSKKIVHTTKSGESRTYHSCCNTMSHGELTARYNAIVDDVEKSLGEIVFPKDENRLFNKSERYAMWKKQKGKCAVTGKTILESEINDDSKWAADHIIPHSKGGKTTIENGQLIDKLANLKKSNKLMAA